MAMKEIRSPVPGTFFRRPSPDTAPYKQVGDPVASGEQHSGRIAIEAVDQTGFQR